MAHFYGWASTASRLEPLRKQFTFYHQVPRNSWYSFYRPRKNERLSQPWSHPVVLITGPLDWESSTLTIRSLLHDEYFWTVVSIYHNIFYQRIYIFLPHTCKQILGLRAQITCIRKSIKQCPNCSRIVPAQG